MGSQSGVRRVSRGGGAVIAAWIAWCCAASALAQPARTVVWLAADAEPDVAPAAAHTHRERALRLELQARDLVLLGAEPAAAAEPDVPGTLASMDRIASQLLERSGAAAVLWLEADDANAVSWLLVRSRGASAPAKTPLPYPPDAIEPQLFALAAASLLDQVLSAPAAGPEPKPEPIEPNPFVATSAQAAAAAPPALPAPPPPPSKPPAPPRKPIEPLTERFLFVNIGVVAAFAEVHAGMEASTTPTFGEAFNAFPVTENGTTTTQYIYNDLSPYVPDSDTVDDYGAISSACEADGTATAPGEPASKYCARVDSPGMVSVPALRFALGTWLRHDVSVAAVYQLHLTNADRPFGNQSVGAEVQYLAIGERSQGFGASLLGGLFVGRYETATSTVAGGSYVNALSGPLGINAGYTLRYAFHSQLAFVFAQHFGLRFPDVQLELDLVAMSEVSF